MVKTNCLYIRYGSKYFRKSLSATKKNIMYRYVDLHSHADFKTAIRFQISCSIAEICHFLSYNRKKIFLDGLTFALVHLGAELLIQRSTTS